MPTSRNTGSSEPVAGVGDVENEGRPESGRPSTYQPPGPSAAEDRFWDPLDGALAAYRDGDREAVLVMRTDVGGAEDVPAALFFRTPAEMGPVETAALSLARGRVLDLGAGPGAHAVPLTRRGLDVTALEVLPEARAALTLGGVTDVRAGGLEAVAGDDRFDTVLVLMNGIGLAGSLEGLSPFLAALEGVLAEGGQILADSTDPLDWGYPGDGRYPGDVHMQLGFQGGWGEPFRFLYVDAGHVRAAAAEVGLQVTVEAEEEDGRYLARITRAPRP